MLLWLWLSSGCSGGAAADPQDQAKLETLYQELHTTSLDHDHDHVHVHVHHVMPAAARLASAALPDQAAAGGGGGGGCVVVGDCLMELPAWGGSSSGSLDLLAGW